MAQLKNLDKIADLAVGSTVTVGNNRTIERTENGYKCALHGHPVLVVDARGLAAGMARVMLHDCDYPTPTTASAMRDFARAFGCVLAVSFARGGMMVTFKNAAGAYVNRACERGLPNGPFTLGRNV